jgi:hypothetical protein
MKLAPRAESLLGFSSRTAALEFGQILRNTVISVFTGALLSPLS